MLVKRSVWPVAIPLLPILLHYHFSSVEKHPLGRCAQKKNMKRRGRATEMQQRTRNKIQAENVDRSVADQLGVASIEEVPSNPTPHPTIPKSHRTNA